MGMARWFGIGGASSAAGSADDAPTATPADSGGRNRREVAIPARVDGVTLPATPSTSVALPTVYRCVALLTQTVQQLDIVSRNGRPLPTWLTRPEFYGPLPLRQLVGYFVASATLHGGLAAYGTATRDGWQIRPIHPARVTWHTPPNGSPEDATPRLDNKPVSLALPGLSGLIYRPYLILPGTAGGVGPIQAARQNVGHALAVDAYAGDVYGNGIPDGTLETDQPIDPATAATMKAEWLDANEQRIRVLTSGLKFNPTRMNPRDAAWLEAREFNAKDIARLFGIPAFMLDLPAGDSMTYSNSQDAWSAYLRLAVMPIVNMIEDALNVMLGEADAIDLDPDALLRPTLGDRATIAAQLSQAGWAPSDIATLLDLPAPTTNPAPAPMEV